MRVHGPQPPGAPDRSVFLGHVINGKSINVGEKPKDHLILSQSNGGKDAMENAVEQARKEATDKVGKRHADQYSLYSLSMQLLTSVTAFN